MMLSGKSAVTANTVLFIMPPGPANVSLSVSSGTAFVGPGTVPSTAASYLLPAGQTLTWATYEGSTGNAVSATVATGTAVVSWWLSTAS